MYEEILRKYKKEDLKEILINKAQQVKYDMYKDTPFEKKNVNEKKEKELTHS